MKRTQRFFAMMLVVITLLALLPASAIAEYKVQSLKFNTWYKLKDSSSDMSVYKFKVSSDTSIIMTWKNYQSDGNFGYGGIYRDSSCDDLVSMDTVFLGVSRPSSGYNGIALYPGTYYLKMYDGAEKAQVKITKNSVKSINKPNYSISRAIALKKGKKVEFAQTKKDYYTRWYKIKLTKPQSISIYGYSSYFELYDSNFNEIRTNRDYDGMVITTDGVQSTGTYYLALHDYLSGLQKIGKTYQIYWK